MQKLQKMIAKLSPLARVTLERAANECAARKHYDIELEHWLLALLQEEKTKLATSLHAQQCNVDAVQLELNQSLAQLKAGNDSAPVFSPRVLELINQAWLTSSVEESSTVIECRHLIQTLFEHPTFSQVMSALSSELAQVESAQLKATLEQAANPDEQASPSSADTTQPKSGGNALAQFTYNLNEQAKASKIDPVIGREQEIRQIIDVLARRKQNNAILAGDPGVGKTAIVEGLALSIVNKEVPENLQHFVIHSLDLGLLQAGASVKGEFEKRLKQLIDDVKQAPYPIILFIDEAHTLIGAGGAEGQNDAANLLKPALARGELRSIAATTWSEYKKYFEKDPALVRRFQLVNVDEPSPAVAEQMLRTLKHSMEDHHAITVLDEAFSAAVQLSHRYISARKLPDKAISVLDTAASRVASKQTTTPPQIEKLENELRLLDAEVKLLEQEISQGIITKSDKLSTLKKRIKHKAKQLGQLQKQWQKEKDILNELLPLLSAQNKPSGKLDLQKQLTKLKQVQKNHPLTQAFVDAQAIAEVISDWTGIPVGNMVKSEAQSVLNLKQTLQTNIVGQDHALEEVSKKIAISASKLADPQKPIGVFLFVGPSGVGKTETAMTLAEQLFGSQDNLTVINMSEFKEEHKVSMLAGSPPGYVGYGEGGVLTEAVRRKPYSLVLLDEMEKAHPGIQDVFYQVFDKGTLKDGQGRDINFKNTVIIMTSNACSQKIAQLCEANDQPSSEGIVDAIYEELSKTFKPAFLGRVNIVPYFPLAPSTLDRIAQLKLEKVISRLQQNHKVKLTYDREVIEKIVSHCQMSELGARQIDNVISKEVLPCISNILLGQVALGKKCNSLHLKCIDNKFALVESH